MYSLSSIASSVSFASRPEGLSEASGSRGRQDHERAKNPGPQRAPGQLCPQGSGAPGKEEEEYEGFSIISTEPLAPPAPEPPRTRFSPDLRASRTARAGGRVKGGSVSSKGSVSSPNSPLKMTLVPSPNSPFQKVGKRAGSDTGDSDQSSTETDSTVKSQEESGPKLDPQELAQKILEETQSHLLAVEHLQRGSGQLDPSSSSTLESTTALPAGASAFRASETSAFSRPLSSSHKGQPPPTPPKPKPSPRRSSLQKVSSGYSSPTASEGSGKEGSGGPNSSQPSPSADPHGSLFRLKYPSSPYSTHISKSPRNLSPSSGHHSPAGSTPSPALSYSSASSACSSPADAPALDKLRMATIDEKVQAIHNLKMFWQSAPAHSTGPLRIFRSSATRGASRRDVLSLLNLSPRHGKDKAPDRLELKDLSAPAPLPSPQKNPPNGHRRPEGTTPSPLPAGTTGSGRPVRLPSGNGYKFLSPGRFFPSSKC